MRAVKIIAAVAAAAVLCGAAYLYISKRESVAVWEAVYGDIQESIVLRGKVELDNKTTVYSEISGIVKNKAVSAGDVVEDGAVLTELVPDDLKTARDKLQVALVSAENNIKHLESTSIPERRKAYDIQKDVYDRSLSAYNSDASTLMELKAAESQLLSAEMGLTEAENQLKSIRYEAENLRIQIKEMDRNLGKTTILAGAGGTVLSSFIEEGSAVQPGSPLFEIGDNLSAYIRVDILADDAARVKEGKKAVIYGDLLGDGQAEGTVYYTAPKAVTTLSSLGVEQQRLEVRISFDNAALLLKPGFGVDVKLITAEKQALYVPSEAVFADNGQSGVFVVRDGALELISIETGIENDDYIEVVRGLEEGDKVVRELRNSLRPGMKVEVAQGSD